MKHIAIEGAIGVGKTTLARRLAQALDARLLLERPEDNPFLEQFYADRARHALPTQLTFLFQRAEQARELMQGGVFTNLVVSDFMFAKDRLFAELTLSDEEFKLYQRISRDVAPPVPAPDLVVWLRADGASLRERVQRRGRPMELELGADDLSALDASYARAFANEPSLPLLIVPTSTLDFEHDRAAFEALVAHIQGFEGPRETFAVPAA
jgi:deoxyguanosine kinase